MDKAAFTVVRLAALESEFKAAAGALSAQKGLAQLFSVSANVERLLIKLNADNVGASKALVEMGSRDAAERVLQSVKISFDEYAKKNRKKAQSHTAGAKTYLQRADRAEGHSRRVSEVAKEVGLSI